MFCPEPRRRCLAIAGFFITSTVLAEELPVRIYTTADGLAHNHINRIKSDSHGYLWFATDAGLSRFDGKKFFTLTTADGLPHPDVNDIVETPDGAFWLATDGGVCRFRLTTPAADERPRIEVFRPEDHPAERFDALELDREGQLWAGAKWGLYRVEYGHAEVRVQWMRDVRPNTPVPRILAARRGGLWIATTGGGIYRAANGEIVAIPPPPTDANPFLESLLEQPDGVLWAGYRTAGLCRIRFTGPKKVEYDFCIRQQGDLLLEDVRSIQPGDRGRLWVCTRTGLFDFDPAAKSLRRYGKEDGLSEKMILRAAADLQGNLWLGTAQTGVMRVARPGFTRYRQQQEEELSTGDLVAIVATPGREIVAVAGGHRERTHLLEAEEGGLRRFWDSAGLPGGRSPGNAAGQGAFIDSKEQWWIPVGRSLYRYPPGTPLASLASTKPVRFQLPGDLWHHRLFEDSTGAIWISTFLPNDHGGAKRLPPRVVVLHPGETNFRELPELDRKLAEIENLIGVGVRISSFREDTQGAVWMGLVSQRLIYPNGAPTAIRYRDGDVRAVATSEDLPPGSIYAIHRDKSGGLWFATHAGVERLDDPAATKLSFRRYAVADGLSSDEVWWIDSDDLGRIYICNAKGIDRLNLATGRIRHFTTDDGLPRGRIFLSLKDRSGRMWFASDNTLTHFDPEPEVSRPPRIYVVRPGGPLLLPYDKAFLQAEFSSPRFSGGPPRFQYRLAGAEDDWGPPTSDSTVRYAGLGPGNYELQARALDDSGLVGEQAVSLRFSVTPPFWRTWWFFLAAAAGIAALAHRFHLNRVGRLLAEERLRLRIASDLHDDIGSNLSQVSMLGELARRSLNGASPRTAELIERMAVTSRETIEAMGDIVWSIHPRNDRLSDMILRMRGFATDVLSARDIAFEFEAPEHAEQPALPMEIRRDLLLIFKEAVNNAARHAGCTKVRASLKVDGDRIRLAIEDNGRGIGPGNGSGGHGLADIRARAAKLGGTADIENLAAGGLSVRIGLPLAYTNK